MSVCLISYSKDYMETLLTAIGQCYQVQATEKTLEHCITSGHLSVLEHTYATFEVHYSRKALAQDTRHRHKSFTVESTRGTKYRGEYFIPQTIKDNLKALEIYFEHMASTSSSYERLVELGIPIEDAAYVLTLATNTSLVVTANYRAWLEWLGERLCHRAQGEIQDTAQRIHSELTLVMPQIFNRNLMKCDRCTEARCSFKGGNK